MTEKQKNEKKREKNVGMYKKQKPIKSFWILYSQVKIFFESSIFKKKINNPLEFCISKEIRK